MLKKMLTILLTVMIAFTTITFNVVATTEGNEEEIVERINPIDSTASEESTSMKMLEEKKNEENLSVENNNQIVEDTLNEVVSTNDDEYGFIETIYKYGFVESNNSCILIDSYTENESAHLLSISNGEISHTDNIHTIAGKLPYWQDEDIVYVTFDSNYVGSEFSTTSASPTSYRFKNNNKYLYVYDNSDEVSLSDSLCSFEINGIKETGQQALSYSGFFKHIYLNDGDWKSTTSNAGTFLSAYTRYDIYKIKYDANGGTVNDKSFMNGYAFLGRRYSGMPTKENSEIVRDGYSFAGWYTDIEGGTKIGESELFDDGDSIKDDYTLYAHWVECDEYTKVENEDLNENNDYLLIVPPQGTETKYKLIYAESMWDVYLFSCEEIESTHVIGNNILVPKDDASSQNGHLLKYNLDGTLKYTNPNPNQYIDVELDQLKLSDSSELKMSVDTSGLFLVGDENKQVCFSEGKGVDMSLVDSGGNVYVYKKKGSISTIGDVINNFAPDFPTEHNYAWRSGDGRNYVGRDGDRLYLWFTKSGSSAVRYFNLEVSQSGNAYIYRDNNSTITFNVDNGILKNIVYDSESSKLNGKYEPPHTHDNLNFAEWVPNEHNGEILPNVEGNWYLIEDVKLSKDWEVPSGKTINLCLNGHIINENGNKLIKCSSENTNLNLYDCSDIEHKGYVDIEGLWHLDELESHDTVEGEVKKSIIGGLITGGSSYHAIQLENGAHLSMNGGTLCGNKAQSGGGVYINNDSSAFVMTGGKIVHNVVTNFGGGISNGGNATITGGEISNNICGTEYNGGGIDCFLNAVLNIGGTAIIKENKKADGTVNNLYIANTSTVNIASTAPKSGMEVGVTTALSGGLIAESNKDYSQYFFSDDDTKYVKYDSNNKKIIIANKPVAATASPVDNLVYIGEEITNPIEVIVNGEAIDTSKYTVAFGEGVTVKDAGTYSATVTLTDESYYFLLSDGKTHTNNTTIEFEVAPAKVSYSAPEEDTLLEYNGEAQTLDDDIAVTFNETPLEQGTDYTIEYYDDDSELVTDVINAGSYKPVIVLNDAGNYYFDINDSNEYIYEQTLKLLVIVPKEVIATLDGYATPVKNEEGDILYYYYVYDASLYKPTIKFDGLVDGDELTEEDDYHIEIRPGSDSRSNAGTRLINAGNYLVEIHIFNNYCFKNSLSENGGLLGDSIENEKDYKVVINQAKATVTVPNHICDEEAYDPFGDRTFKISFKDRDGKDIVVDGETPEGKQAIDSLIEDGCFNYGKYFDSDDKQVDNPTNVGKYYTMVTIGETEEGGAPKGNGNFYLSEKDGVKSYIAKVEFEIVPSTIDLNVNTGESTYVYTGSDIEPEVVFTNKETGEEVTLIKGTDYNVTYSNNKISSWLMNGSPAHDDKPTATVTLIGEASETYAFYGEEVPTVGSTTFDINPMPLFITLDKDSVEYGSTIPSITFKDSGDKSIKLGVLPTDVDLNETEGYQVLYYEGEYSDPKKLPDTPIEPKDIKKVGKYTAAVVVSRNYCVGEKETIAFNKRGEFIHSILLTFEITTKTIDYKRDIYPYIESLTYNGNLQSPIKNDNLPDGVEYASQKILGKDYHNFATDANKGYKALIHIVDENYVWSLDSYKDTEIVTIRNEKYLVVPWSIAKKEATINVLIKPNEIKYGDPEPKYIFTGEGFVDSEFNNIKKSLKVLREPGTNVGNYTVVAYDASTKPYKGYATRNYEVTYNTSVLTIVQKELPLPVAKQGLVYTGKAQDGFNNLSYLKGIAKITGQTRATDAGTYAVTFEITNKNYKWVGIDGNSVKVDFTIAPAKVSVKVEPLSFVYNGKPQQPRVILTANGKKVDPKAYTIGAYSYNKLGLYSDDITNVGKKYVAVVLLSDNYILDNKSQDKLPSELNAVGEHYIMQYEITPRKVKVAWSNESSFIYNGVEQKPTVVILEGLVEKDTKYIGADSYVTKENGTTHIKSIDVGSYVAHAVLTGDVYGNYVIDNTYFRPNTKHYEITPKHIYVEWINAEPVVYDGKAHSPNMMFMADGKPFTPYNRELICHIINLPVLEDKEVTGKDFNLNANTAIINRVIDAGDYRAHALITGKLSNYIIDDTKEDLFGLLVFATKDFTIHQRDLKVLWSDQVKFKYDGKEHAPEILGAVAVNDLNGDTTGIVARDEGVVELKLDITNGKKIKPASNYIAEAVLASKGTNHRANNYRIVENKTINFKIYRKPREDSTPVKTGVDR